MEQEIWGKVLTGLKTSINKQSFDMWLKDTESLSVNENIIKIEVVDDVARRHITDRYLKQIGSIAKEITGKEYIFEFLTTGKNNSEKNQVTETDSTVTENPLKANNRNEMNGNMLLLNPKYTFDNFVVGPNNQLAHAAANAVAQSPATQFNPLFIYGQSGMGKTHLMHAIGHYIINIKPFLKVLYLPTEQFVNEFIQSIRTNTQDSFKIKYRNVDILMIDDIQFIEKKEETQNEFFHTFNTLYDNKKQIIISSDRPPKQLSTLTDRLRTRFEWGMITDIQPPNLETREAILRNKAEKENINVTEEALNYIASRIKSSIRALEAALSRLKLVTSLTNEQISINHAKIHLKDLFDVDSNKRISAKDIMAKVADNYDVTVEDMISKRRLNKIVMPRFVAMYLVRKLTSMTTSEIGKDFGDRDHSTVINAINQVEENFKNDPSFKEMIDELSVELKN